MQCRRDLIFVLVRKSKVSSAKIYQKVWLYMFFESQKSRRKTLSHRFPTEKKVPKIIQVIFLFVQLLFYYVGIEHYCCTKKETFNMFYDIVWLTDFPSLLIAVGKNKLYSERDLIRSYMKKKACWVFYQTILFGIVRSLSVRYSDKNLFSPWKVKFERLMFFW